jgi:acetyltransferase
MELGQEALYGITAAGAPATLWDGRRILLRPVRAGDAAAVQSFVRALSPQSRRRRFLSGLAELTPYMLRRLTQPVHPDELGLVALADGGGACSVVGIAQCAREKARSSELGIAVADAWQGQGLGTRFVQALTGHALRSGIRTLSGVVLAENRAALAMLKRLGWTVLGSPEPGLVRVEKPLARLPGASSYE